MFCFCVKGTAQAVFSINLFVLINLELRCRVYSHYNDVLNCSYFDYYIYTMSNNSMFESIKHTNEIGQEYWSARELFKALEYIKWDKFLNVIDKAKEACKNSGFEVLDHFPRVEKMIDLPQKCKERYW